MSEAAEVKRDGAKAQKNSGRGKIQKGDAIWYDFTVDYKEYNKSISISRDVWAKICTDAWTNGAGYKPLLKLILGSGSNKTRLGVIEWSVLEELVEKAKKWDSIEKSR